MVSARTGSAPLYATFQLLRSRPSRCSEVILRTHSSYAKLGPPLIVAWYREMACNHRTGRCRKDCGGIRKQLRPLYTGWIIPLVSPMSWKAGSHVTDVISDGRSKSE